METRIEETVAAAVAAGMAPAVARRLAGIDAEELSRQLAYLPYREEQNAGRLRRAFDAREPAPAGYLARQERADTLARLHNRQEGASARWRDMTPGERLNAARIAFWRVPGAIRVLDRGRKGRMLQATFYEALRDVLTAENGNTGESGGCTGAPRPMPPGEKA